MKLEHFAQINIFISIFRRSILIPLCCWPPLFSGKWRFLFTSVKNICKYHAIQITNTTQHNTSHCTLTSRLSFIRKFSALSILFRNAFAQNLIHHSMFKGNAQHLILILICIHFVYSLICFPSVSQLSQFLSPFPLAYD